MSAMYYVDEGEDCMELCDQTDGCVGASHNGGYYNACVMYSQVYGVSGSNPQGDAFVLVESSSTASSAPSSTASGLSSPSSIHSAIAISCPASDRTTFLDPSDDRNYELFCESLLTAPGTNQYTRYRNIRGRFTFAGCAAQCDSMNCPGFVYSSTSNACGVYNAFVGGAASATPSQATAVTLAWAVSQSPSPSRSIPFEPTQASTSYPPVSYIATSSYSVKASNTSIDSMWYSSAVDSQLPVITSSTWTPSMPSPSNICPGTGGEFTDNAGYGYSATCSYDMPGGDFESSSITPVYGMTNAQECLARCDATPGCVAIVYASDICSDNWCHCFLKDKLVPYNYNRNYDTYVRVFDAPSVDNSSFSTLAAESSLVESYRSSEKVFPTAGAPLRSSAETSSSFEQSNSSEVEPVSTVPTVSASPALLSSIVPTSSKTAASPRGPPSSSAAASPTDSYSISSYSTAALEPTTSTTSQSPPPSASYIPAPTPPDCPQSNDTVYAAAEGAGFQIMCYMDLYKNAPDLGRTITSSFQGCMDACDRAGPNNCQAVSWVPSGQPQTYCYFEPAVDQYVPQTGGVEVWSAMIVVDGAGA